MNRPSIWVTIVMSVKYQKSQGFKRNKAYLWIGHHSNSIPTTFSHISASSLDPVKSKIVCAITTPYTTLATSMAKSMRNENMLISYKCNGLFHNKQIKITNAIK